MNKEETKDLTVQETTELAEPAEFDIRKTLVDLTQNPDIDPERLEKFMTLQERWEDRQAQKAFNEAMARFQGECPTIKKKKKVDFTSRSGNRVKYNYSPLEEITGLIKPIMDKHGLAFTFSTKPAEENETTLMVKISHVMGHSEVTEWTFPAVHDDQRMTMSQRKKSALSYAKRAGLENALGIVTEEEDDDSRGTEEELLTDLQNKKLHALIKETNTNRDEMKAYFKLESMKDMTKTQAETAIHMLETKKANRGGQK